MLARPIRWLAFAVSAIVIASFTLFAVQETHSASAETRARIAQETQLEKDPQAALDLERLREQRQGRAHEAIDDANDAVTSPFQGLVSSSGNVWARRGAPSLLALLVFGLGLGFLARFAQVSAHSVRRAPAPAPYRPPPPPPY